MMPPSPAALRTAAALLSLLTAWAVTSAASAPTVAATRPATSLIATTRAAVDSRFLAAQAAVREKRLPAFAAMMETQLSAALRDPAAADLDEITRLATLRQFARMFSRIGQPSEGAIETLAWLAGQEQFATTLTLLATPHDPPDRVLEVLRGLRQDHREQLDAVAGLAAAICVTWDDPERFGPEEDVPVDLAEVSRIFAHFSANAARLKVDPRKLPAELLIYVADVNLIEPELRWAWTRYGGAGVNVAGAFRAVPYTDAAPYERGRKGEDDRAYVLPNILRRGGNASDAAYFASQLAKLAGVPSMICRAPGADAAAAAPAWVIFLHPGRRAFDAARLRDHAGWRGETVDPQTGERLTEADIALLAGLIATPAGDRHASAALLRSIDLAPAERRRDLLLRAVDRAPASRPAWWALADHAAAEKLDAEQLEPIESIIQKHLGKLPEFALSLQLRMLRGRGSIEYADGLKRAAVRIGAARPDLLAQIALAQADRQIEAKQYAEATRTLIEDVLSPPRPPTPPVALQVMIRLDDALRKQQDVPRLAAIYGEIFNALPRPAASRHGRSTAYYQIGAGYAAALDEIEQAQQAGQVRVKIQSIVLPAP